VKSAPGHFLPWQNDGERTMTLAELENALDEVLVRIEEFRQMPPPAERHRVARELLRTLDAFLAMVDELERELVADALDVYHHARRLAKEQGPDSHMAEVAREMERAWRASYPRARRKRKGKAKRRLHNHHF
jgi:hypothetical protein